MKRRPARREVLIAAGLAIGPLVALGLGRFGYALLLPAMRDDLGWGYTAAGALNTANAVGHLVGALLAAPLARRWGARRSFLLGLVVTTLSMAACAATASYPVLTVLRALAGIAGAVTFVVGGGLAAQLGARSGRSRATLLLGVYFAGSGVGIMLSGAGVPVILDALPVDAGWRWGWLSFAAVGVLTAAGAVAAARAASEPEVAPDTSRGWSARRLLPTLAAYALFGVGYIAYMTFIVDYLADHGVGPGEITVFWVLLGVAVVVAAFVWGPVLARLSGGVGLALVLGLVAVGALMPMLSAALWMVLGSALVFGVSFLSVVTGATMVARASLPAHLWTPAIAGLTVAFALGQCVGPVLSGLLSDGSNGLSVGLLASVGVLVLALLVALLQRGAPRERADARARSGGDADSAELSA